MNRVPEASRLEWLLALYDENYQRLLALAPVRELPDGRYSSGSGGATLLLDVLEQQPYTSLLRLSLAFNDSHPAEDPEAYWRVYHDVRQAEVTHCRLDAHRVRLFSPHTPARRLASYRRRMNAFASKWLEHLRESGYGRDGWQRLGPVPQASQPPGLDDGAWEGGEAPRLPGTPAGILCS